jgi:4-amino-4-deoxy-L-arabinose transferase-like glycosyltransferase
MDPAIIKARRMRFVGVALIAVLGALLLHSALRVGPTFDEHFYIASGLSYLEEGNFTLNREHPPLLKLLAAAPIWSLWKLGLLDLHWPPHAELMVNFPSALLFQLNGEAYPKLFFLARLPLIGLTLLMVIALWRKARAAFGEEAGIAAILLGGLNPNTLANGHLAALDGGVTALIFIATLTFAELFEKPTWRATLKAGLAFGLANLAKSTALLLGPATGALAVLAALRARSMRPVLGTVAAWFVGFGVFALGYGFTATSMNAAWGDEHLISTVQPDEVGLAEAEQLLADTRARLSAWGDEGDEEAVTAAYSDLAQLAGVAGRVRRDAAGLILADRSTVAVPARLEVLAALAERSFPDLEAWRTWFLAAPNTSWDQHILTKPLLRKLALGLFGTTHPIPLLPALVGLDYQLEHAAEGHTSFYNGRVLASPGDFEDGNPYPGYYTHVLALKNPLALLVLFVLGLALAAARKTDWRALDLATLVGIPALLFYTFSTSNMLMGMRYILPVLPFMALVAASTAKLWPRTTLALATLSAVSVLTSHPHELMYFNTLAGGNDLRAGGPAITIVSDDWGQGVRRTGELYKAHHDEFAALGGFYYTPQTRGSLRAFGLEGVPRPEPGVEGIVAVHALDYWRDATTDDPPQRVYAWLDELEPFAVIDDSVYLFDTRPGEHPAPPLELD